MQLSFQLINILTSYEGESVVAGEYRPKRFKPHVTIGGDEDLSSSLVPDYLTYKYQSLESSQLDLKISTFTFLLYHWHILILTPHLLSST
jgi:hypothetical protein